MSKTQRFLVAAFLGCAWLVANADTFDEESALAQDIASLDTDPTMGYVLMNYGSGFALAVGPISSGTFDTVQTTEFYTNDGAFDYGYGIAHTWQEWSNGYTMWILGLHPCQTFVVCVEQASGVIR